MLVVPHLAWPLLFGMNHVKSTKALIDGNALTIQFRHPNFSSVIKCNPSNPLTSLPSDYKQAVSSQTNSSVPNSEANITCLLTGMPSPTPGQSFQRIPLHQGLNLITVCLLLTTSLIGSQIYNQTLWFEGNTISPGITALSGPTSITEVPFSTKFLITEVPFSTKFLITEVPFSTKFLDTSTEANSRCKPKCSPSQPLFPTQEQPPDIPTLNAFICEPTNLSSSSQGELTITNDNIMYCNVVIKSNHKTSVTLPFNAILGPSVTWHPLMKILSRRLPKKLRKTLLTPGETWYQSMSDNNTLFSMPSLTLNYEKPHFLTQ